MLRRRRRLEKLPCAEIIFLLEIRGVRISGATLLETRQNVLSADRLWVNVQKLKKKENARFNTQQLQSASSISQDRFFGVLAVRTPITEYNSQSNHYLPWLRIEVTYSFQKLFPGVCASYKRYEQAVAVPVAKKDFSGHTCSVGISDVHSEVELRWFSFSTRNSIF